MLSLYKKFLHCTTVILFLQIIVLGKLGHYGIRGKELEWFDGYLSGRKQGLHRRGKKQVDRGVPQGSILGRLLFILYVLPQIVQNSSVKQYADDTTMTLVAKDVAALEKGLE